MSRLPSRLIYPIDPVYAARGARPPINRGYPEMPALGVSENDAGVIADYLIASGEQVRHILGKSHVEAASLTPGACVRSDRMIVYPTPAREPR